MTFPLASFSRLASLTGIILIGALFLSGCASSPKSETQMQSKAAPTGAVSSANDAGVTLHKDKDIQGVWLAPGFNFTGYDALFVEPTEYAGIVRDNETKERQQAISGTQAAIVSAAQATIVFPKVTAGSPSAPGKNLVLKNTIIKFEKGGGAARYFAGLYGAGQPHIRVRGKMYDSEKLVCVFEVERSGEGGGARMFGGYMGDDSILSNDIRDLASDLAEFFKRTSQK
jgi:hypothetical protein